jgi:predicted nucleic acid-binding protein
MPAVILDTNIYIRAAALEPADEEAAFLNTSRHDRESSPEATRGALSARQCRALLCRQALPDSGILVPAQQAEEFHAVAAKMRATGALAAHNESLLACAERFVRSAAVGHRVPVPSHLLTEQYEVLKEALSIAAALAERGAQSQRYRARRFVEKNERFLVPALPEPNIQRLQAGEEPFLWSDWLLCQAARRAHTVLITIDRDFEFIAEAFRRVTGYTPARYIEAYPAEQDVGTFRRTFGSPGLS